MNRVVVIGPDWSPHGPLRYLADGFQFAGCAVLRVGPPAPFKLGDRLDDLPKVFSLGLFDRSLDDEPSAVETRPVAVREVVARLRERQFEPDLVVVDLRTIRSDPDFKPRWVVTFDTNGLRLALPGPAWAEAYFTGGRSQAIEILRGVGLEPGLYPYL